MNVYKTHTHTHTQRLQDYFIILYQTPKTPYYTAYTAETSGRTVGQDECK